MLQLKFHIMALCLVLVANVWAFEAPKNPGSALILYNSRRSSAPEQREFDHSIPTMQIFRAALDDENVWRNHLTVEFHPNLRTHLTAVGRTAINPPLVRVTALDVDTLGIDRALRTFGSGLIGRERAIFDELYNQGNPLSYWSQVYDLRYIQEFWNPINLDNTFMSVITQPCRPTCSGNNHYYTYNRPGPNWTGTVATRYCRNDGKSDLEYFRAFLRDGGGIYIQAASANYVERNQSLAYTIRALTEDRDFQRQWSDAEILIGTQSQYQTSPCIANTTNQGNRHYPYYSEYSATFWFNPNEYPTPIGPTIFALDFNPLVAEQGQNPMRWVNAGGIAANRFTGANAINAIPLVRAGANGSAIIVLWDGNGLQEEFNNGRLIASYGITAWKEHHDGCATSTNTQTGVTTVVQNRQGDAITSRATLALIQNLYASLAKTRRYNINKNFADAIREVGQTGILRISVRNPNLDPFVFAQDGGITDDLAPCLSFVSNSSRFFFVGENGDTTSRVTGQPAQPSVSSHSNGQRLFWTPREEIPRRGEWIIEFQYRVDNADCRN